MRRTAQKAKKGCCRNLKTFDELFIVLCCLRRGFSEQHLAHLYGLVLSTVSRIFIPWINFIYLKFSHISIWPSKAVVIVVYTGSISDRDIVIGSGFLSLKLEDGNTVMADKGFQIEDLLPLGVKLNTPPFIGGNSQMSAQDVIQTQKIASVRIHKGNQ